MPKRTNETPLTGKTTSGKVLTEQEELFCNEYVRRYSRIEAAVTAYDIDMKKKGWKYTASSIAYENLLKPHINERIRELLDSIALTDEVVDHELKVLIDQNAELSTKKGAIDIYNKMKGRYSEDNKQKQAVVVINAEKKEEIEKALDEIL